MDLIASSILLAQIAMGDVRILMKARGHDLETVGCSGSCGGTSAAVAVPPETPPEPSVGACEFPASFPCEME